MPIITASDLTKTYGDFTAVNHISFSVEPGEIVAFLGPNGAGKSTTIKMLTTLTSPTSGSITLNGYDPVKKHDEARKQFGIVFQDFSLDDELTTLENMHFHAALYNVPRNQESQRINELLDFVELSDRKNSLVKTFSGGMKRRLEIARGLLHHPKLLFLDEPTVGLDPQTRNHMWAYLQEVNQREHMTIFFTTHYMEEAEKIAQRIIVIDHGQLIAEGTSQKLMEATQTATLEDAFLKLTGSTIRDEEASGLDHLRQRHRMHHG